MKKFRTIIIGGGPAGLFCSICLGREGHQVLLLEKMQKCGRKLLISGSGQCNLTHAGSVSSFFSHYGDHGKFLKSALMHFSNQDLIRFFEEHNVDFSENDGGKIFPRSGKARDILEVLSEDAQKEGVEVHTKEPVLEIIHELSGFRVKTEHSEYYSDTLVLATGGFTYPVTGSNGDGFSLAHNLGHTIVEPGPALTPIYVRDFPFKDLSGISFSSVKLTLFRMNKKIRESDGDILITHLGFSGPGILDLSRYIRIGDELRVSFIPYQNIAIARDDLIGYLSQGGTRLVKTLLSDKKIPERFVKKIMDIASVPADTTCAQFSKTLRTRLISLLLEYPFQDISLGDRDEAMVTRGGVSLDEIKPDSMESKVIQGLYCIGEVLDIDGDCGGYNLQAAFSTGALSASGIHKKYAIKKD